MYKLFLSGVMPLAALVCLWFAVVCLYRGLSMLVRRIRLHLTGLHASSALRRGEGRYVSIFTYVGSRGEELDIMGREEYATEQAALQARRPLVFDAERPDSGMACCWCWWLCWPRLRTFSCFTPLIDLYELSSCRV